MQLQSDHPYSMPFPGSHRALAESLEHERCRNAPPDTSHFPPARYRPHAHATAAWCDSATLGGAVVCTHGVRVHGEESTPSPPARRHEWAGRNPATMNSATLVHIAVYPHLSSHRAVRGPIRSRRATASAPRAANPAPARASAMTFWRWVICSSQSRITRRYRRSRSRGPRLRRARGIGGRAGGTVPGIDTAGAVPTSSPRAAPETARPLNRGGRLPPRARSVPCRRLRSSSSPPRGGSRAPRACSRTPPACSACGTRAVAGG